MAEVWDAADWPFVQNGAVTLFLREDVLDEAIAAMEQEGYLVHRVDCSTDETFLAGCVKALRWEEQFGYLPERLNLDALNDAMRGGTTDGVPRALLVFDNFGLFHKRDERRSRAVLDILETESRNQLLLGHRLTAFVHTTDPATHLDGLGGRTAQWNPKEWLNSSRGLQ